VITVRSKGTSVVARPEAAANDDFKDDDPQASQLSSIRQLDMECSRFCGREF
jgi:hypothetical protein